MISILSNDHLLLPTCKGIEIIKPSDIVRIEAIGSYSKLYFADDKTLVVAKVLSWFADKLSARFFVRVHRSQVINLQYGKSYLKGHNRIILYNNTIVKISRRRKRELMKTLSDLSTGRLLEPAA